MKVISIALQETLINFYGDNTVLRLFNQAIEKPTMVTAYHALLVGMHIERVQQFLAKDPNRSKEVQAQILELEELRSFYLYNFVES